MIRPTSFSESAFTASAIARYVLPVPAGPIANVTVDARIVSTYALLRDGLRRDLLAAVAPDDVLEHVADVRRLVERRDDGADRVRADRVAALDELDELVDDRARLDDPRVVAVERQPVAAQRDRAAEPLAQRVEHAVAHPRELGGHLVRNGEDVLHAVQCRAREFPSLPRPIRCGHDRCGGARAVRRGLRDLPRVRSRTRETRDRRRGARLAVRGDLAARSHAARACVDVPCGRRARAAPVGWRGGAARSPRARSRGGRDRRGTRSGRDGLRVPRPRALPTRPLGRAGAAALCETARP